MKIILPTTVAKGHTDEGYVYVMKRIPDGSSPQPVKIISRSPTRPASRK